METAGGMARRRDGDDDERTSGPVLGTCLARGGGGCQRPLEEARGDLPLLRSAAVRRRRRRLAPRLGRDHGRRLHPGGPPAPERRAVPFRLEQPAALVLLPVPAPP